MADLVGPGDIVFIEGVPSSGKTSVARELQKGVDDVEVVHGDDLIKKWGKKGVPSVAFIRRMFDRLLDVVEEKSSGKDVIVDMTIPKGYLADARKRFPDAVFVSLRVSEAERRARERKRNRQLDWDSEIAAKQAPERAFDLVIETTDRSPTECAEAILDYLDNKGETE